jgi:hypothetical protein
MLNLFTVLLFIPLAASFIAERSGVMDKLKYWLFYRIYTKQTPYKHFRLKPFDCAMCLSFWIAAVYEWTTGTPATWLSILLPFSSAAVGSIISKF